jgi:diguanylate cyclase (GGDEF)-like protein
MRFQIEINTMILAFIFGNLFTILLITAYRIRSPRDTASLLFIVSKWLQLGYWSSLLIWDELPHRIIIPFSNLLMLCGGCLEMVALLSMLGLLGRNVKIYYLVIIGCSTFSYIIISLFFNQSGLRIASASFWVMVFILYPARLLTADKGASPLQKMMGTLFYLYALIMGGRTVSALWEPEMTIFTSNLSQNLYYIGMFLLLIMYNAGFFLLSNERSHEKLKKIAAYDELTGILSRRAFMLEAELKLDMAVKKQTWISLLLLDLDHFKQVNDSWGHDVGDTVLKDFALTVRSELENSDLFGRLGGEEFAVLLYGADEEESDRKAEAIRLAVMNYTQPDLPLHYTVSIGVITVKPQVRSDLDKLYKISDTALYQAKQNGRNRVVRSHWS